MPVYLLPANHYPATAALIYLSDVFVQRCPKNCNHAKTASPSMSPVPAPRLSGCVAIPSDRLRTLSSEHAAHSMEAMMLLCAFWSHTARFAGTLVPTLQIPALIDHRSGRGGPQMRLRDHPVSGARAQPHSVTEVGSTGRIWYSDAPPRLRPSRGHSTEVLVVVFERPRDWSRLRDTRWATGPSSLRPSTSTAAEDVEAVAAWLRKIESKEQNGHQA